MTTTKQDNIYEITKALQREAGGGVCKAVKIVAFFDAHGNLIGKTKAQVVKMHPANVCDFVGILFDGAGDPVSGR